MNDTLGDAAGDRVIVRIADQLRMERDDDAVVSRFGGDEFTILLRDLDRKQSNRCAKGSGVSSIAQIGKAANKSQSLNK